MINGPVLWSISRTAQDQTGEGWGTSVSFHGVCAAHSPSQQEMARSFCIEEGWRNWPLDLVYRWRRKRACPLGTLMVHRWVMWIDFTFTGTVIQGLPWGTGHCKHWSAQGYFGGPGTRGWGPPKPSLGERPCWSVWPNKGKEKQMHRGCAFWMWEGRTALLHKELSLWDGKVEAGGGLDVQGHASMRQADLVPEACCKGG